MQLGQSRTLPVEKPDLIDLAQAARYFGARGEADTATMALLQRCAENCHILKCPCPELVEFVERGELDSPALTAYLARQLGPYAGRVDAAVLGCTHFPFARRAIRAALGGNVTLYDGSDGTARETLRQLVRRGWVRGGSHGAVTLENSLPSELPLSRRLLALPRED